MIMFLASWTFKASFLLALGLLLLPAFRRISSSLRHHILAAALLGAIAIGPFSLVAPAVYVGVSLDLPEKLSPGVPSRIEPLPNPSLADRMLDTPSPGPDRRVSASALLLLALWLLPAVLLFSRTALCRRRLGTLARRTPHFRDGAVLHVARQLVGELRLSRPVRVLEGERLSVPFAFGFWRPVVMLPLEASSWPSERMRLVLVHELMHIRRMDSASLLLAEIACALFWFNPLVWMAARQMKLECERACDEQVLATTVAPKAYANCLIATARDSLLPQLAMPLGTMPIVTAGELESRLRYILAPGARPLRRWTRSRPYLALTILPVALSVSALHAKAPIKGDATLKFAKVTVQAGFAATPKFANWLDDPRSELLPSTAPVGIDPRAFIDPRERAAVERLLPFASHRGQAYDDLERERANWALAQIAGGKLVEPLVAKLGSKDWRERAYAAWALTEVRDMRAVEPMKPLLTDPIWRVRMQAAFALPALGAPLDRETAIRLSKDPAWQVRLAVVESLERLPDAWSLELLSRLAQDKHNGPRMAAEEALEKARRL